MNTNLIEAKENRINNLRMKLEIEEKELKILKKSEEPVFSLRQLEFRRDDAKALINKYRNPKFYNYRSQILDEIKKKYLHLKSQKEKNDKKFELYEKFIAEIREEMKNELFNN